MSRDHQLFVGRDDVDARSRCRARYQRSSRGIGGSVELDAKPGKLLGDAARIAGRVFADAGGENKRIESAERRRQHPGCKSDAIDEIVDGKLRASDRRFDCSSRMSLLMPDRPFSPLSR